VTLARAGFHSLAEGGSLPRGENRETARPMLNNQPLVLAKPVPPGWKHRLYGRQDARRHGGGAAGCAGPGRLIEMVLG